MKSIFFLLLVITSTLAAQNVDSLFVKANELYKTAQFTEAIETYKQIENKNQVSSDLYYNLGNSYYKLNKVGPAIFYYEKALQLNPDNEDVKNNLVFAKRLALDNIEPLPKTVFQKLNTNYLQALTYNQWAVVVVVFSFLGGVLFLFYYFSAPTFNSEEVFILHEGTKVFVLDAVDDWKKIQLADGKQGWIIASEVQEF
jgi:tetratricopeptide (TPR) repeat protein